MIGRFFFLALFVASLGVGYGMGSGKVNWVKKKSSSVLSHIHPDREVAPTEYKSFAVVLHAHNDVPWCEKALRSIFSQDYDYFRLIFIDDGSTDGTFAKVQQFVIDNGQQHRVILMRNEEPLGSVGCIYRAVEHCLDREILLPCSARNWFAVPSVLSRLNQAFQNPDVWITFGQTIGYPSYQISNPPKWNRLTIEKEGYGDAFLQVPPAFYAALFKQLPLGGLVQGDRFVSQESAYLLPLLELSGGRFKSLLEPISFQNETLPTAQEPTPPHKTYEAMIQFPQTSLRDGRADIVLFSFDRPLQLYGTLESIGRYLTGYEKVSVLYRASDDRFEAGYRELKRTFPSVYFIKQGETPKKDFKPLFLKAVFDSPAEYVLFGVDDLLVKETTDLKVCMEAMEKTGAYGFYLRLGHNIHHCYQIGKPQEMPPVIALSGDLYAWDLKKGEHDWGFPNTVDMTLYRKKDLKDSFYALSYSNPNSLEFKWAQKKPENQIALCFQSSRVVNIPLNVVKKTGNPHMNYLSPEELLVKFNQRLKIDLDPLYKIENPSPHFEYTPEFIPR